MGGWSIEAIQTIADIGRLQGQRLGITPVTVFAIYFKDWPFRYGGGMPPCGSTDFLPALQGWMVLSELFIVS